MHDDGRIINRPFVVGFAFTFFLYFGIGGAIALLPRLVTHGLHGNKADVGRLSAVFAVAAVACRPLLSLVSRRGARTLAVVGGLFAVGGSLLLVRPANLAVLGLGRVLAATGEAIVWTAFGTLATIRAAPHRQAEAVSLSSIAIFAGIGVGPLATESLSRSGRFTAAALIVTAANIVCLLVALLVDRDWVPPHGVTGRLRLREVVHPGAILPGLALALATVGMSAWMNYIALRADELRMANAAVLFTVYSIVSLSIRLLGAKLPERIGIVRCASVASVFIAAGLLVLGSVSKPVGLMVGAIVLSLGVALNFPSLSGIALRALRSPSDRTALLSSFGMFFEIGLGVGGLVIGPIANAKGIATAFRAAALAPLLALGALVLVRRSAMHAASGKNPPLRAGATGSSAGGKIEPT